MKTILVLLSLLTISSGYAQDSKQPKGLSVGDKAPNFTLPTIDGKQITLYKELEKGPVVITFYRGAWCRYCMKQLIDIQDSLSLFEAKKAKVIAITAEASAGISRTIDKTNAQFPILHDSLFDVALKFKTVTPALHKEYQEEIKSGNGFKKSTYVPVPAAYIVDKKGIIRYVYFDPNYRIRVYVKDLLDNIPKG